MSTTSYPNLNGHCLEADPLTAAAHPLEEPVQLKGFSVTYERKFNLGNFESLNPAITIWVKSRVPEGMAFDLHDCKERVRRMARENCRAQWQRLQGNDQVVFLGLQPPANGGKDPIFVRTVSVSLFYKANLGNYQSIMPGYTDWADLHHATHSPGELHMALERMWASLWNNVLDEISHAQGHGSTGAFFGLPPIEIEDLTPAVAANGSD
ncbi:MAG: hypothetical protein L0332_17995 [Chloroflexi bacterium]|nr:hypothetical protein [Chloroflexota bacterium]MCI0728593.1 hypothetical protein [Chloroflexota bacterium]